MTMNIAQASTAMHQAQVQQQAGMAALRMGMEASQTQAQGLQQMASDSAQMQQAATATDPQLGQQVNLLA